MGHSDSHPEVMAKAEECLAKAKQEGLLIDYYVTKCGDDVQLIMTHERGVDNEEIHKMCWDTFVEGTEVAKKLGLYGAGQDVLTGAIFMVLNDLAARTILSPTEIPIGVITAICGAPFFLYLLRRRKKAIF